MFGTKGLMIGQQSRYKKSRLGDLLVSKGKLSQMQLQAALQGQKKEGKQLGQYLCDEGIISRGDLTKTLMEQFAYRALALSFTVFISLSSFAQNKKVRAENADNSTQIAYNYAASQNSSVITNRTSQQMQMASLQTMPRNLTRPQPKSRGPVDNSLFGSREVKSGNLTAFTKWNDVLAKLDNAGMQNLPQDLMNYRTLSTEAKVDVVNKYVNRTRYIEDNKNWGKSDYWATPAEFFVRGGDCEDFAIAKFAILKMLGVPESQMRLAIVQDRVKNIPHAVLIVYTQNGPMMLDNQMQNVQKVSSFNRYDPIYSINRSAWWRHLS